MIIKQSRIPVGDAVKLAAYFVGEGENERIDNIMGDPANIIDNDIIGESWNADFGNRHIIVSPEKTLNTAQFRMAVYRILKEFNVTEHMAQRLTIVRHSKPRSDDLQSPDYHYHIALPEVDPFTGKQLDVAFYKTRSEKIARRLEIEFGHPAVVGKSNKQIYDYLQKEGVDLTRYREALIAEGISQGMSIREAERDFLNVQRISGFSTAAFKALKNDDIDISSICRTIRAIPKSNNAILRKPRHYAAQVQKELGKLGGKLVYDEITGKLELRFGSSFSIKTSLQRMLGLNDKAYSKCEFYLKEIAQNEAEDELSGRRLPNTADTRRNIDDPDSAQRGQQLWRIWRESVRNADGFDRIADQQHRQAASRDDVAGSAEHGSHQDADEAAKGTSDNLRTAETVKFNDADDPFAWSLDQFDLKAIHWLTMCASAKLKQLSNEKPPAFEKPLIDDELPLLRRDYVPSDLESA